MISHTLLRQMRKRSFLFVIGFSILIGYACVPAASDGYEIFYINGVRGIYNSAWLGGLAAILSTMLLWLFGFYLLRGQISEDERLKLGPIIAASKVSNFRYISSKAICNFIVLLLLAIIFTLAFVAMQLFRGEDSHIHLWGYTAPFLFITLPSLMLLSSLTVGFDVFRRLKGTLGNIVFFSIWLLLGAMSIDSSNPLLDVFGLHVILSNMAQQASFHFPSLAGIQEGGSFGYYKVTEQLPKFSWTGLSWGLTPLVPRILWIIGAITIVVISTLAFNRFNTNIRGNSSSQPTKHDVKLKAASAMPLVDPNRLTAVKKGRVKLWRLVLSELRIILGHLSRWWYMLAAAAIVGSLIAPLEDLYGWLPFIMLAPLAIWSQMGTREKHYFTKELLSSVCSPLLRWYSIWIAGIIISLLASSGVLLHFILEAQWSNTLAWGIGTVFVPTLALTLGDISGSRKTFEVIFLLWWYAGPVNHIPSLDFLGISANYSVVYSGMTVILLLLALVAQFIRHGSLPK